MIISTYYNIAVSSCYSLWEHKMTNFIGRYKIKKNSKRANSMLSTNAITITATIILTIITFVQDNIWSYSGSFTPGLVWHWHNLLVQLVQRSVAWSPAMCRACRETQSQTTTTALSGCSASDFRRELYGDMFETGTITKWRLKLVAATMSLKMHMHY